MSTSELVHRVRPAEGDPSGALVLLHGRGTDENDLFGLFDIFDPRQRLVGVTVRGPLSLPPGGQHWYGVYRVGFPDPETFHSTYAQLDAFLGDLPGQIQVPWEHTVIGGFSQGAVMAYALGLGAGRPAPAGILAMSGFMGTVDGFEHDLEGRTGLPVAITHGTLDPVISVEFAREAKERLERAGVAVTYRESPMAHRIDPRLIPDIARWLEDTVESAPTRA
jgi:phospholipase/carboxylesterase